jgi:hypothetical protein
MVITAVIFQGVVTIRPSLAALKAFLAVAGVAIPGFSWVFMCGRCWDAS